MNSRLFGTAVAMTAGVALATSCGVMIEQGPEVGPLSGCTTLGPAALACWQPIDLSMPVETEPAIPGGYRIETPWAVTPEPTPAMTQAEINHIPTASPRPPLGGDATPDFVETPGWDAEPTDSDPGIYKSDADDVTPEPNITPEPGDYEWKVTPGVQIRIDDEGVQIYQQQLLVVGVSRTGENGQIERITETVTLHYQNQLPELNDQFRNELARMALAQEEYREHPNQMHEPELFDVITPGQEFFRGQGYNGLDMAQVLGDEVLRDPGKYTIHLWSILPIPEDKRGDLGSEFVWIEQDVPATQVLNAMSALDRATLELWWQADALFNLAGTVDADGQPVGEFVDGPQTQYDRSPISITRFGPSADGFIIPGHVALEAAILVDENVLRQIKGNETLTRLSVEQYLAYLLWNYGRPDPYQELFWTVEGQVELIHIKVGTVNGDEIIFHQDYVARRTVTATGSEEFDIQSGGLQLYNEWRRWLTPPDPRDGGGIFPKQP